MQKATQWDPHELKVALKENPVVVVGRRGCCMVHVINCLLAVHGVKPTVLEVGEDCTKESIIKSLCDARLVEEGMVLPLVFVGGELVGELERVMAVHLSGELVTKLKQADAI